VITQCGEEEVRSADRRQSKCVVGGLRISGRDLAAGAVGVIIGGREGAEITEAEVLAGDCFIERSAPVSPLER